MVFLQEKERKKNKSVYITFEEKKRIKKKKQ